MAAARARRARQCRLHRARPRRERCRRCGSGSAPPRTVPGFIGFAVGRTVFWQPLVDWRAKKSDARAGGRPDRRALSRIRRSLRHEPVKFQEDNVQLGMIGLGRMGANMVRRLLKGGHQCVVFDMSAKAVAELVKEKAVGTASLAEFVKTLDQAARGLADGAGRRGRQDHRRSAAPSRGRRHPDRRRQLLLHRRHPPRQGAGAQGHPLCRCRHQRRRLGPRARLLHDDRRRDRRGEASRSDLRHPGAGPRRHRAHAGPRQGRRHGRAGLSALRAERRRPFRQDGAQRHRIRRHGGLCRGHGGAQGRQYRQADRARSTPRPRRCAIPSTISTISTCPTLPRSGAAAA